MKLQEKLILLSFHSSELKDTQKKKNNLLNAKTLCRACSKEYETSDGYLDFHHKEKNPPHHTVTLLAKFQISFSKHKKKKKNFFGEPFIKNRFKIGKQFIFFNLRKSGGNDELPFTELVKLASCPKEK